jgi:hypothetical protein
MGAPGRIPFPLPVPPDGLCKKVGVLAIPRPFGYLQCMRVLPRLCAGMMVAGSAALGCGISVENGGTTGHEAGTSLGGSTGTGGAGGATTGGGGQSTTSGSGGGATGGAGGGAACTDPAACATHVWSRALDLATMTPLALDAAGNILFGGTTVAGSLELGTGPLPGSYEGFVAKLSPAGEVLFAVPIDAGYAPGRVAADGAGNVLVLAATGGPHGPVLVRKLTPAGDPLWSKLVIGDPNDMFAGFSLNDLAVRPDGAVVASGSLRGTAQVDGVTLDGGYGDRLSTALVLSFDGDGQVLWHDTAVANNGSGAKAIAVDPAGLVWMAGNSGGAEGGSFGAAFKGCSSIGPTSAIEQVFLAQFDEAGTCPAIESFDGEAYAYARHLVWSGGDVFLGGTLHSQDPSNLGAIDLGGGLLQSTAWDSGFLGRRTAGGAHAWSRLLPEGVAGRFDVDASGSVLLPGYFEGSLTMFGAPQASAGDADVYLARLGAGGSADLVLRYGGAGRDTALSLAVDAAGAAVVNGTFESTVDFGGGPLTAVPHEGAASDFFLVKLTL